MEMFQYDFMQRALMATLCIAIIAPILGLLLILRRQSLLADTLSHVSLAGVALGLLIQVSPTVTTIIVVVVAAIVIEYLRMVYKSYSEISVAILMSSGLAAALLLMSFAPSKNGLKLDQYLFGSLVTVTQEQVWILAGLAVVISLSYLIFNKVIYVVLFNEDTAFTDGLPVQLISLILTVVTGVTISVMMPIAGALLVASILILPSAIAMRVAKSFTQVIVVAMGIGLIGMVGGLMSSYQFNTPPGATITLIFVIILVLVSVFLALRQVIRSKR